jgi:hypothetical protein
MFPRQVAQRLRLARIQMTAITKATSSRMMTTRKLGPVNTHWMGCVAPPIACSKAQSAAHMSIWANFVTQLRAIRGATHLMNK